MADSVRRRGIAIVLGLAATAMACSGDDDQPSAISSSAAATTTTVSPTAPPTSSRTPPPAPASTPVFEPDPLEWEPLNDAVDVATLEVPLDYADPGGERIELALARFNALDQANKIGTLLVNPGGPGFGGSILALGASQRFDRPLLERFDIIGWDPRGTGDSVPAVDCIDDYDEFYTRLDATPDDAAERAELVEVAERFVEGCLENSAEFGLLGTNNSARDIDAIRRALGEATISYFGFSYGSELGAAWATLFPDTVRAVVLDGAADPYADTLESMRQQMAGFEAALTTFLTQCSADESCAFHNDGDAEGAFDALMVELDAAPIVGDPDRPPVNRDVAIGGVALAMYSADFWPSLAASLAAARGGDGSGLLELYDSYYQRLPDGSWGNELEAFQVISCADNPERLSVAETDAQTAELHDVAPRLVPEGSVGGYFCTFFPPAVDPRVDVTGRGAGPIVVIGTTGDPSTPLASTRRMRDALEDGRLIVVEADQHTGYGVNRCVIDAVNAYLIDLEAPTDETECS